MRWRNMAVVALAFLWGTSSGRGGETDRQKDEQEIRRAATAYLAALAAGDTSALRAAWTTDGEFIDEHGKSLPAAEVVEQAGPAAGQEKPQYKITSNTIRFLTADVALEEGTSEVVHPGGGDLPALPGRFSVIWVRRDGRWRIAQLRETRSTAASRGASLEDLNWMIGEWSGQSGDSKLEITARWNPTRTFLLRDLKISRDAVVVFRGSQRIGWDPLTNRLKSWVFDTHGGYGEGAWTRHGDDWVIQGTGVLADGQRTSSLTFYKREGPDAFRWKSLGGLVGAAPAADLDLTLVRNPSPQSTPGGQQ